MATVNAPQPAPIANASVPIVELVLADLEMCGDQAGAALASRDLRERAETGRAKYGVYLQAHNGRDALVDAYQEAQDLVMYLRQRIAENRIADPAEYDDDHDDLAIDYSAAVRLMLRLAKRVKRDAPAPGESTCSAPTSSSSAGPNNSPPAPCARRIGSWWCYLPDDGHPPSACRVPDEREMAPVLRSTPVSPPARATVRKGGR